MRPQFSYEVLEAVADPLSPAIRKTARPAASAVLGWLGAYAACLIAGFSLAFTLHAYTRASVSTLPHPGRNALVVSAWPQPEAWMEEVFEAALA
jgi:hypothetical protein